MMKLKMDILESKSVLKCEFLCCCNKIVYVPINSTLVSKNGNTISYEISDNYKGIKSQTKSTERIDFVDGICQICTYDII